MPPGRDSRNRPVFQVTDLEEIHDRIGSFLHCATYFAVIDPDAAEIPGEDTSFPFISRGSLLQITDTIPIRDRRSNTSHTSLPRTRKVTDPSPMTGSTRG